MPKKDPRIDDYISGAADFAKPILNHLRKLIHAACPKVEETIKWNSPFYLHQGILIATPAFKKHCPLIFWKGKVFLGKERETFRRLTSSADLPGDKILLGHIRKAAELNETGVKIPARANPKPKKEIVVPDYFLTALEKDKKAFAAFRKSSGSHQREYVEWVAAAKQDKTRDRRIKSAVRWLAAGKTRNWKYQ